VNGAAVRRVRTWAAPLLGPEDVTPRAQAGAIDRVGQVLSFACAVHCALMPLVLGLLPLAAARAAGSLNLVLAPLILGTALVAFVRGHRRHRSLLPGSLAVAGCVLLLAGLAVPSETLETVLTICASAFLVIAHARNHTLCHRCCDP
jgi:hypothetical protein